MLHVQCSCYSTCCGAHFESTLSKEGATYINKLASEDASDSDNERPNDRANKRVNDRADKSACEETRLELEEDFPRILLSLATEDKAKVFLS